MIQPIGRLVQVALLSTIVVACSDHADNQNTAAGVREFVVVYTSMGEAQTAPLFRAFENTTGSRVQQVIADDDRLLEMMLDKHHAPVADLFIADGAAVLWQAAQRGVFRPTYAGELDATIPSHLRDPENLWFGIALSANVLVINASLSEADMPADYASLADDKWRGRICLSSSTLPENIVLVAWLIEQLGKRDAELVVRRMLANLALPVFDDSASLVTAVGSGQCEAGIARLDAALAKPPGRDISPVRIVMPAAASGGTQVDVVGAGVTRHAGNPDGAKRLLLWLAGEAGQRLFSESDAILPVSPPLDMQRRTFAIGSVEQSEVAVFRLAELSEEAVDLAERARYH